MKIKKNIFHIAFLDFFFGIIILFLISLAFFLGFELTKKNVLIYLLIIISVIVVMTLIYVLYYLLCKTYYVFKKDSIIINKNNKEIKTINHNQIKYCEYYGFIKLIFGDPKGGNLIIYYLEDKTEKIIKISFSKKLIKKIFIENIFIK